MPDSKRSLLSSHPLAIALTVAVILFLIAGFLVLRRSGRAPSPETISWGVSGAALPSQDPSFAPTAAAPSLDFTNTPTDILRFTVPRETQSTAPAAPEEGFDSFLSGFLGTSVRTETSSSGLPQEVLDAYFYLPQGTLATTVKSETPSQAALHAYGNAAGAIILGFESAHPQMLAVLEAQSKDRKNEDNAAALTALAADLAGIGAALENISDVPPEAGGVHAALAAGYKEIGAKLALVAETGSDEAYLASINDYNAAADAFTRRFIELATLLSISGVTFSSAEEGSAFTLLGGGGF